MNYQLLKTIIDTELKRFEIISEDEWAYKNSPEKWSRKEILGHLCDSAFTNIRRFVVTQYKEMRILYMIRTSGLKLRTIRIFLQQKLLIFGNL